jgi:hypothetical protein
MVKLGFLYTHDEYFAGLGMYIPYYLLMHGEEKQAAAG